MCQFSDTWRKASLGGGVGGVVLFLVFGGTTMITQNLQLLKIEYLYVFTFYHQQILFLELAEQATDGFHRHAKQIGDVVARHAEIEFGGGLAPVLEAFRELNQETGQT